ncbi:MAG: hypothetical protein D6732_00200 [Methanobacteriota archaeon]|nr:MAG: hypothetical protein D6732_00200 [Euryarchaeota archaeon]
MKEKEQIIEAFKKELKQLLKKYDACIVCEISDDVFGINHDMCVELKINGKTEQVVLSKHSCEIEACDL